MMYDGFIHKLDASLQDNNHPVLGQFKLHMNASGSRYIIINGTNGKIKTSNGSQIDQNGYVDEAIYSPTRIGLLAGEYDILCDNKYSITQILQNTTAGQTAIDGITFNLDGLKYANNLTQIYTAQYLEWISGGDLSSLSGKALTKLKLLGTFTGNINSIDSQVIEELYLMSPQIEGNINTFVLPNTINILSFDLSTGVTGSVETFAEAQGRTSGTLRFHAAASGITYNGSSAPNKWIVITFTANGPEYVVEN